MKAQEHPTTPRVAPRLTPIGLQELAPRPKTTGAQEPLESHVRPRMKDDPVLALKESVHKRVRPPPHERHRASPARFRWAHAPWLANTWLSVRDTELAGKQLRQQSVAQNCERA